MFFILRCIFWLSLVVAHLPGHAGGGAAAGLFLDLAGRHIDGFARHSLAQAAGPAADLGSAWCQANGDACIKAVIAAMRARPTSG